MIILFSFNCSIDKNISEQVQANLVIENSFSKKLIGQWVPEYYTDGWVIEFKNYENYEEYFNGEGCGGYKGKYFVDDKNRIKLQPNPNESCVNKKRLKENLCTLQTSPKSLYSDWKIICGNSEYYSVKDQKKDGTILYINSIKTIALNPNGYFTKDNVAFREGPGINFKSISCGVEVAAYNVRMNSLPEKSYVFVIARTTEKFKVKESENYWYYVKPYTGWHSSGCDKKFGWIFGEYLERREEN